MGKDFKKKEINTTAAEGPLLLFTLKTVFSLEWVSNL